MLAAAVTARAELAAGARALPMPAARLAADRIVVLEEASFVAHSSKVRLSRPRFHRPPRRTMSDRTDNVSVRDTFAGAPRCGARFVCSKSAPRTACELLGVRCADILRANSAEYSTRARPWQSAHGANRTSGAVVTSCSPCPSF